MRAYLLLFMILFLAACGPAEEAVLPTSDVLPTATPSETPTQTQIPSETPTATATMVVATATQDSNAVAQIDLTRFDNVYTLPNGLTISYTSDMRLVPQSGADGVTSVALSSRDNSIFFDELGAPGDETDIEALSELDGAEIVELENGEAVRLIDQGVPLTRFQYALRHPEFGILLASGTIDEAIRQVPVEQLDGIVEAMGEADVAEGASVVFEEESFAFTLDSGVELTSEADNASAVMVPEMEVRVQFISGTNQLFLSFNASTDFDTRRYSLVQDFPDEGRVTPRVLLDVQEGAPPGLQYELNPNGFVEITENDGQTISGTVDFSVDLQTDTLLGPANTDAPSSVSVTGTFSNLPITVFNE